MAKRVSDSGRASAQYRAAQLGLTKLVLRQMKGLWRLVQPGRLQASVTDWIAAVQPVVDQYGAASASLAAEFYDAQRTAAGVSGAFSAPIPDAPAETQVESALRWATKDVWPRDPDDPTTTNAQRAPLAVRLAAADKRAQAVTQKLVADQGRALLRQSVQRDRFAVGYARAAALNGCSFCKLMASRGAVYKSAATAGRDADELFAGDASVAKFHDHCHCGIIPVFAGQTFSLSPQAAEWARLYQEYAQGHPGSQLQLFRQAVAKHSPPTAI